MVDNGAEQDGRGAVQGGGQADIAPTPRGHRPRAGRHPLAGRVIVGAAVLLVTGLAVAIPSVTATTADASPSPVAMAPAVHTTPTTTATASGPSTTTLAPAATAATPATSVTASAPVAAPAPQPSVASLVARVEAAGIVPPSTWTWSMGDTAAACGVVAGAGGAGCTSWSSGVERTVFSGAPSLALVAHEVANAEVEQSALPALLQEVSTDAAGTSWSPTDAVASCLVADLLGFQDGVAGSWQCPAALATSVAAHIHDTVVTTQTTAVCGSTSGIVSTLTFTATTGTLTVTTPSSVQTAAAGAPVTVSGVGTFTARVVGGTAATLVGVCEG